MEQGKVIIILGISASGKTYFKNYISEKYKLYELKRVITRPKRKNEKSKSDINVSKDQFKKMKQDKKFFIYTQINKEFYGYLNDDKDKIKDGINVIGDCYYKLLKKLRKIFKDNLIVICIQPYNFNQAIEVIKKERIDYKKRIKDAKKEYKFYNRNKEKIDYMVYNQYSEKTNQEICQIMNNILEIKGEDNEIRVN